MTDRPEIMLVMARARNGVIGRDGTLPWRLPADLRHFKRLTMGRPMIMGRATFDSLPGILPSRRHIVLTRDPQRAKALLLEGVEVAGDAAHALRLANAPQVAVIGGASVYGQFLPLADRIELTHIDLAPQGDTVIDAPDPIVWNEVSRDAHPAVDGRPAYAFSTYVRHRAQP